MKIYGWLVSLCLAVALFIGGCTGQAGSPSASAADSTAPSTAASSVESSATASSTSVPASSAVTTIPAEFSALPRLNGKATVELTVKGTPIVIEVDGSNAPLTAGNFVDLVNKGVYDGLSFHRVVRDPQPFVVQGGDPQSKDTNFPADRLGTGSYIDPTTNAPRYIPLEIKPKGSTAILYSKTFQSAGINDVPALPHKRGAVAMARSSVPDSASSQFYVALADLAFLDGSYAVFGNVTSGMEVVDQIQQGDRITTAKVTAGLENLKAGG